MLPIDCSRYAKFQVYIFKTDSGKNAWVEGDLCQKGDHGSLSLSFEARSLSLMRPCGNEARARVGAGVDVVDLQVQQKV